MKIIRTQSKIIDSNSSSSSKPRKKAKKTVKKKINKKPLKSKTENKAEENPEENELTEFDEEIRWRDQEIGKLFKKARKKKRGQPTKLSEDIIRDMEVLARIGIGKLAICESVGITYQTYDNWMEKDENFALRMNQARNKGKTVLLNSIFGAGKRNWQAHAWLLERQYRSEFGAPEKTKLEVTGKDDTPLVPAPPTTVIIEYVSANNRTEENTDPSGVQGS